MATPGTYLQVILPFPNDHRVTGNLATVQDRIQENQGVVANIPSVRGVGIVFRHGRQEHSELLREHPKS